MTAASSGLLRQCKWKYLKKLKNNNKVIFSCAALYQEEHTNAKFLAMHVKPEYMGWNLCKLMLIYERKNIDKIEKKQERISYWSFSGKSVRIQMKKHSTAIRDRHDDDYNEVLNVSIGTSLQVQFTYMQILAVGSSILILGAMSRACFYSYIIRFRE